jgi:hypothetical protein
LLLVVVGCISFASGCSDEPTGGPSAPDRAHQSATPDVSTPPSPAADQGTQLAAWDDRSKGLVGAAVSTPWQLLSTSDDRVLVIRAEAGGCFRFARAAVDEDDDSVLIASVARDEAPADPDVVCTTNLTYDEVRLTLEQPLGDRELLHAPISAEWTAG